MPNKILIVEDEEFVCNTLERILKRSFDCVVEKSGEGNDALKKIKIKKFDLIILDLKLPGMSGLDLIKFLKQENIRIKILVITGSENKNLINELKKYKIECLSKPIISENFLDKVQVILS